MDIMKYLQEELIKSGKSSWTAFTFKNNLLWYVICFNYVVCFITDCFEIIFKNICHPSLLTYSWSHRLLSSLGKPSLNPPPPKVWKIIYFFSNRRPLMELFFWNFEKYPKISKGGTLGIFLLLDIFLNFWKFSQNIQRGDPHKKIFLMHFWMNWGYKKKCGTGLTPPPLWKFPSFFWEPFP